MKSEEVKTYNYEFVNGWVKYLDEDLYFALPAISSLAEHAKVDVPLIDALVTIYSIMQGIDYMKDGVTIEDMGLDSLSIKEIKKVLESGF